MHAETEKLSHFRIAPTHQLDFNDLGRFPTKLHGIGKKEAAKILAHEAAQMEVLQEMLHASKSNAFLLLFQALDAAGKDSAVKHGLAGLNVLSTKTTSYKAPTPEELKEEFLDRHTRAVPQMGEFGIWVRSHYEEVGAVRVHPEYLKERKGPSSPKGIDPQAITQEFWDDRIAQIQKWEEERVKDSTPVVKIFLNASPRVRMERLLERTQRQDKHWKIDVHDLKELDFVPQYNAVYQEAINKTSTSECPWYVIPADDKQEAHILVARIVNYELERLKLKYPHFGGQALKEIEEMGAELERRIKKA